MRRHRKRASFHLDIAPVNLIDLLLVLLIFFVTTTSFLQLKVIELNVPSAKNNETKYKKDATFVVSIRKDCSLYFERQKLSLKDLSLTIKEHYEKNSKALFQVGAHQDSPHRCFVNVLDLFKENGVENISILTKMQEI
jgi:biopolymer transport protein ExbD